MLVSESDKQKTISDFIAKNINIVAIEQVQPTLEEIIYKIKK